MPDFKQIHIANRNSWRIWRLLCQQAQRCFAQDKQEHYSWLLTHSSKHTRPEVRRLQRQIKKQRFYEFVQIRLHNYSLGLLGTVFDPFAISVPRSRP